MRHNFVPRGGCHRRSCLGKSAIAAPTMDGITVVCAQGSTLERVHPEIRRTSRSHLAVMHALGVPSLLTCRRDPLSCRRSCFHLIVVRTSRHYQNLALCRVLGALSSAFFGHSAKKSSLSVALGKVLLSVTAACQTLGERQRSAKGRQQSSKADDHYLYRAPSFWLGKEASLSVLRLTLDKACLPSAILEHSTKYIFLFLFSQPNFLWYVPTLCRPTCTILAQL
jgi:hypothetical protein